MNFSKSNDISALWARLRELPTRSESWLALARSYAQHDLQWQAGYAALQALRLDAAQAKSVRALNIEQSTTGGEAVLGRQSFAHGPELVKHFGAFVEKHAGDWLTWLYLARLREMPVADAPAGQSPMAAAGPLASDALQQAGALEHVAGESLHRMGVWRLNGGDAQGAVQAFSALLNIRPLRFGSMMHLGEALLRIGNTPAAEKAFARASLSENPDFLLLLSTRVYAHNYWQEAIAILKKAIALRPRSAPLWLALARIQSQVYLLSDCRESLSRLLALEPDHHEARLLSTGLHGRTGDASAYLKELLAAYKASGDPLSRLASSVAMTSLYVDSLPPSKIAAMHRKVCQPIEASVTQKTDFKSARVARKKLRVGLVTGDLHRQHPVNIFMLPVLQQHDRKRVEFFIYHTGTMHDEYTRRAKACAGRWVEAGAMDDAELHRTIVKDEVDVLVDLAGHTATHRLGVFAMRAAPVQATFLGYPHSTGLAAMDWLIGDAVVSPADHARLFSEGIAQLPGSVFCWAPVDAYPLPPARKADAPLVFGSFNNATKLSPKTIDLWARILLAVPDALLLLKAPSLRDEAVKARYSELFAAQGISPERLILRGPTGLDVMMQEYGDVDIALDPTPYNGGTTTLQALWMGVPVVTLSGGNFVARMGASFMTTLGQPDWVASDEAGYVQAAVGLAGKVPALREGRARLREQIAASPLCDIKTYTKDLEDLFFRMWDMHCSGNARRVIEAGPAADT